MLKHLLVTFTLLGSSAALAAPIAVIDSGTDLKHPQLVQKAWTNTAEIAGNGLDDDGAGYIDDISGWNFAENNNEIIDYKHLGTFSKGVYDFFDVQYRLFIGSATDTDKQWYKEHVVKEGFAAELSKFGNFIHGTHVAGIVAQNSDQVRIMGIKLIPTEVSSDLFDLGFGITPMSLRLQGTIDRQTHRLITQAIDSITEQQANGMTTISQYVSRQKMKVANCSFGTNMNSASNIMNELLPLAIQRTPTTEEVDAYARYFMKQLILKNQAVFNAAPNTLFVMAAGNDGQSNDEQPVSPANVKLANTITVAATWEYKALAKFSNYGKASVDIAAPGLGIQSAIPGSETLMVSGTSQAAPFITNLAGRILDINSRLSLGEVKTILLNTVDKKDFLKDKVASGGVANVERALEAARLSLGSTLSEAIEKARRTVSDVPVSNSNIHSEGYIIPLTPMFVLK